jgi:hypothetical protein
MACAERALLAEGLGAEAVATRLRARAQRDAGWLAMYRDAEAAEARGDTVAAAVAGVRLIEGLEAAAAALAPDAAEGDRDAAVVAALEALGARHQAAATDGRAGGERSGRVRQPGRPRAMALDLGM